MAARLANSGDEHGQRQAKAAAEKKGNKNNYPAKMWPWVEVGWQWVTLVAMEDSNGICGCSIDNGNSQWCNPLIERVEVVVKGRICFERVGDIEVVKRTVKSYVTILSGQCAVIGGIFATALS